MPKNDDLINDILRELDSAPQPEQEEMPEAAPSANDLPQEDEPQGYDDYTAYEAENYGSAPEQEQYSYDEQQPQENIPEDDMYYQQEMYPQDEYAAPQRMAPPRKKKKRKKKRNRLPGVLILTTLIFAVSIILSMVIIGFGKDMLGIGKSDATKLVVIKEGATTEEIAQQLKDEGIIKSPKFFMLFSKMRKSDALYIPGEHFIRPNMAYETIIQNLTTNEEENKETVEITFPEGITLMEAAQLLQDQGICNANDFIFTFNAGGFNFPFEEQIPEASNLKFYRMEGYLFPDTYFFYKEMEPEKVCQKIYSNFDQKMTPERYEKMKKLDIDLDQLITLASIVQQEAATKDTMTLVASVFWNRLRNPEEFANKLQSDPTKNYSQKIKKSMQVLDQAVLDAYNTYVGTGLPPGAICNPGIEAIDAVLEDHKSDYYYFYANVYTGQTRFAKTYEEHLQNEEIIHQEEADYEAQQQEAENNAAQ